MKFTPASMAACSARIDSPSSAPPHAEPPIPHAPKLAADTCMPVRPSARYSIVSAARLHRAELDDAAGPGVGLGHETNRDLRLPASQRLRHRVLLVEELRRVIFEVLRRDLLTVHEDVERAPLTFAAAERADERQRSVRLDLQRVADEPVARIAPPAAFHESLSGAFARESVRLFACVAAHVDAVDRPSFDLLAVGGGRRGVG